MNALAQTVNSGELVNEAERGFASGQIFDGTGNRQRTISLGKLIDLAV
ncbi:MAG: hypothetical protein ACKVZH_19120 [Blastocatellia bacterium]